MIKRLKSGNRWRFFDSHGNEVSKQQFVRWRRARRITLGLRRAQAKEDKLHGPRAKVVREKLNDRSFRLIDENGVEVWSHKLAKRYRESAPKRVTLKWMYR